MSVLLLGAVLAGAAVVSRSPLFAIDEVRIEGVGGARAGEVERTAAVEAGQNLLDADLRGAGERVSALPWVRAVEVRRVPPSTVSIEVEPRIVVATVNTDDASWLVDAEGVVVAGGSDTELLRIDAVNSVLPGPGVRISDAAVRNALAVHAALPDHVRQQVVRYSAPDVRGLRVLLRLREGRDDVWVRFGTAERVEAKAKVIDALLTQARDHFRDDGAGIAELDVRAPDNPVLVPAGS